MVYSATSLIDHQYNLRNSVMKKSHRSHQIERQLRAERVTRARSRRHTQGRLIEETHRNRLQSSIAQALKPFKQTLLAA